MVNARNAQTPSTSICCGFFFCTTSCTTNPQQIEIQRQMDNTLYDTSPYQIAGLQGER